MSNLTLDGSTRYIGTEFIKLLATGSSNLATESYVNIAVANGAGGTGTTDLTNYYTKSETEGLFIPYYTSTLVDNLFTNYHTEAETNTLLDTKLNVDNPQDMSGTLRIGHVLGTSKIILNAVSSDRDFYVNGDSQVNGNHLVQSLDSTGYIKGSNIQTNTFNTLNTNDILFQSNSATYLQYDVSENKIIANKLIQCGANLKTQEIDTIANLDLVIKRNGVDFITLADGEIQFNQPTNLAITPDLSNCVKLTGEASQTIAGDVVVGGELRSNTLNSNGNSNIVLQRNGIEYMKLEGTLQSVEMTKGVKSNTYDSIGNADVKFRRNTTDFFYLRNGQVELNSGITLQSSSAKLDTINTAGDNDMVFKRNGVDFMAFSQATGKIFLQQDTEIQGDVNFIAGKTVQVDNINTVGNNDLVLQRNGVEYMKLDDANNVINFSKGLTVNGFTIIKNPSETLKIEDTSNQRYIRFALGKHIDSFDGSNAHAGEFLYLNYYSQNTVVLGNDIMFFRASDVVVFNQPIKCNIFNSSGDTDVLFQRNGVEYFKLDGANNIVNVATGRPLSSSDIYTNEYRPRSNNTNTIWYGLGSGGTGYVEIFRHSYASSSLDFNCSIDNTGLSVIGNIIYTTVSDERLKANIKDYNVDCIECVKNVNVKTFIYKDNKYRSNDTVGFIAQQLLEHLPDEFKNIVKENKEKDSDNKYLSINYMKLSVVLWKALQEEINRREQIESKVFEMMNDIEELKKQLSHSESSYGRSPKPKPKAKTKPKSKPEN